jgi:hypothetical protein
MRLLAGFMLFIAFLFLAGCGEQQKHIEEGIEESKDMLSFKSADYGFSFLFPATWKEVKEGLPRKWAIVNENKDIIIFTVNDAPLNDLLALGKIQALRDLQPKGGMVGQGEIDSVNKVVRLISLNSKNWYTYAMQFSDKNVSSIVSGTLCSDKEVNLVLVSNIDSFDLNKGIYIDILNSFEC